MNIYIAVANRNQAETEHQANYRLERARVRRIAAECERLIGMNAHVPSTVSELSDRREMANKRIAELDAALAER